MSDAAKPKNAPLVASRERLLRMRNEEFARTIRGGQLPRIDAIDAVLAALDEAPIEAKRASAAVVSNDGQTIRLTLHIETGTVGSRGARSDPRDLACRLSD